MISKEIKARCLAFGLNINERATVKKGKKLCFEAPVLIIGDLTIARDVSIGAYTYLRSGGISSLKSIGRYCSFGPNVMIGESNHPMSWLSTSSFQYNERFAWYEPYKSFVTTQMTRNELRAINKNEPQIGSDVWVGANVQILRGVTIGDGAVIAAGAVVNKDVEPYEIVGGLPAKHIKYRFPAEIRAALLELRWWDYNALDLSGVDFRDIEAAIKEISRRRCAGDIAPSAPVWKTYLDGHILED